MLCMLCGRREATGLLISAREGDAPAAPLASEIPVEYVEPRRMELNVCEDCMSASASPGMRERAEAFAAELAAARVARVHALPNEPPAPAVVLLTEAVMRASTEAAVDLQALRDALAALAGFLASPAGRTHANCTMAGALLDSPEAWRRVNRNRARWQLLPAAYSEVLYAFAIVAATFADPALADGLEGTPEQLALAVAALRRDPPPNETAEPANDLR